jgi:hypothetical protein
LIYARRKNEDSRDGAWQTLEFKLAAVLLIIASQSMAAVAAIL